jgi:hypothetical protein
MQLDTGVDLVGVGGAVAPDRVDLGEGDDPVLGERGGRIGLVGHLIEPHRDLPDIGATDQPGAPARRAVAKRDQRVLVPPGTLLGVAAQAIGQALPGRAGAQAQALRQAVVQAHRHVHRHV